MIAQDPAALFMLDTELAARVYVPLPEANV